MPIWLLEFFGGKNLEEAFLFITFMTAPVWAMMLLWPDTGLVRRLASPFVLPPAFLVVLGFLLWKSWEAAVLPPPVDAAGYEAARDWIRHPVAFLVLYCNWQIVNLALGTMIFQKAGRGGFRVPFELIVCWLMGAVALLPFLLRLVLRRQSLQ